MVLRLIIYKKLQEKYGDATIWQLWGIPNKEKMLEMYGTLEEYLKVRSKSFSLAYCVMTPDGEWHEPGTVGYFGMSNASVESERDWELNFYDNFIKDLKDDASVFLIDCHI